MLVGNEEAIYDESIVQKIEAIAAGDLNTEDFDWENIAMSFKDHECEEWKPEELWSHLKYILKEIDRISDHRRIFGHVTTYTDGVKLQNFDGKKSVLLVVAAVTPKLILSATTDESLDSMWNLSDEHIEFVCHSLNELVPGDEDQVSVEEVEGAADSLDLLFASMDDEDQVSVEGVEDVVGSLELQFASIKLSQRAGRKRKASRDLFGLTFNDIAAKTAS